MRELARRDELALVGMAHAAPEGAAELANLGVEIEIESAPLGVLWQQLHLPRRLARGDIDLFWSPLLTLPNRLGVPGVVTIHDLAAIHHPETLSLKIRWSLLPFLARTVEQAARIVTVSHAVAGEIAAQWPAAGAKTVVIPNGVGPEFRPADEVERAAIRARLELPDRYLLYAGTVEPRKNLAVLLDAWERLRRERESTPPLVVAGPEGWGSAATERRMHALASLGLRRLGHLPRPDLVDTLRAATILVYPSFYEGFGLPPLEALACGVPPVVANRSSLPELVGDAGFLFDPDAADELHSLLATLLDSPGTLAAAAARGVHRARTFTWTNAAYSLSCLFREVLAEVRPPTANSGRRK